MNSNGENQSIEVDQRPLSYSDLKRWLGLLVLLIAAALLAWALKAVLLLFAVVFLVAMVLNPIIAFLQRRRIPRGLAVALLGLVFVGGFALALSFLIPPLLTQIDDLIRQTPEIWNRVQAQAATFGRRYPSIQQAIPEADQVLNTVGARSGDLLRLLFESSFRIVGGLFGSVFAVLLLVFILINPGPLVFRFLTLVPDHYREASRRTLLRLTQQMAAWAHGVIINGTISAITTGLLMALIGVQPALVFGFIAFLGEFVPMIGPVLTSIPALFVALSIGLDKFGLALLAVLFVQQVETNILVPFILGKSMELNPVSILFFTLAMSSLFGLTGAVLSVPATALFKIVIDEFYLRQKLRNEHQIQSQANQIILGGAERDLDKR
ncbi:MAG: AI-2E family transporter [Verrucomicrobia bacterium]|nr:AI-2E family transporter [Verrucomicrobiota bacterium]